MRFVAPCRLALRTRATDTGNSFAHVQTAPLKSPKLWLKEGQTVLMLGTDPRTRGGIAAVIETYRRGGLFDQVPITLVSTHEDGGPITKGLRFARASVSVLEQLARRRTALVHAHVSSHASFWRKSLLLLVARRFGVPTVFHLHSGGFAEWATQAGWRGKLRRRWVRHTLEASDAVIVLTNTWAVWMQDFAPGSRVTVIGNPVQLPLQNPFECARGSSTTAGRVLFLGWIYDFKGVYDLLNAWTIFRQRCPGWKLVVGGKGEVDKFLAAAERLGVRNDLEFLGWVSGKDKERELLRADIFVLPSYREGMPVSLLEAMAHGVAIIATPVGGVPDMMQPDIHGLWIQPGDVSCLADRLSQLANDPSLRQALSRVAYHHVVEMYSVERSIESIISLYARLSPQPGQ